MAEAVPHESIFDKNLYVKEIVFFPKIAGMARIRYFFRMLLELEMLIIGNIVEDVEQNLSH